MYEKKKKAKNIAIEGGDMCKIYVTWQFSEVSGPKVTFSKKALLGIVLGSVLPKFRSV